jgi:hypothetical protein
MNQQVQPNDEQQVWHEKQKKRSADDPSDPGFSSFLWIDDTNTAVHLPDLDLSKKGPAFRTLENNGVPKEEDLKDGAEPAPAGCGRGGTCLYVWDSKLNVVFVIADEREGYGFRNPAAPLRYDEGNDFMAAAERVLLAELFISSKDRKKRFVLPNASGDYSHVDLHNGPLGFTVEEAVPLRGIYLPAKYFWRKSNRAVEVNLTADLAQISGGYFLNTIDKRGDVFSGKAIHMMRGTKVVGTVEGVDGPVLGIHTTLEHELREHGQIV